MNNKNQGNYPEHDGDIDNQQSKLTQYIVHNNNNNSVLNHYKLKKDQNSSYYKNLDRDKSQKNVRLPKLTKYTDLI